MFFCICFTLSIDEKCTFKVWLTITLSIWNATVESNIVVVSKWFNFWTNMFFCCMDLAPIEIAYTCWKKFIYAGGYFINSLCHIKTLYLWCNNLLIKLNEQDTHKFALIISFTESKQDIARMFSGANSAKRVWMRFNFWRTELVMTLILSKNILQVNIRTDIGKQKMTDIIE